MKKIEWYHSLIVFAFFIITSQSLGYVLILAYFQLRNGESPNFNDLMGAEGIVAQAAMMLLFFILVPLLYLLLIKVKRSDFYNFKRSKAMDLLWSTVGILSFGIILSVFLHFLTESFPFIDKGLIRLGMDMNFHEILADLFRTDNLLKAFSLILIIGIFPGFGEEFLFRGFMQRLLHQRFGFFMAVLLSGGLFGFIHAFQQISQAIGAFLISFYLGYIYYKSKNLLSPMIAHAINNSTFGLMVFLFPNEPIDTLPSLPVILLSIPFASYSIYYFSQKNESEWH